MKENKDRLRIERFVEKGEDIESQTVNSCETPDLLKNAKPLKGTVNISKMFKD